MSVPRLSRRRLGAPAGAPARVVGPAAEAPRKERAAAISILSNSLLIALKLAAGVVTGSIAILTEAAHSCVDLTASVIAYFSVRKAEEPADESHPYGHQKVENLAAAIEGMLILVGAAVIVYESVRRLAQGAEIESLGIGIAVVGFSAVANFGVSGYLYRQARVTDSPALEGDAAHLRTDALTSLGVLIGLVLVEATGLTELDAITALIVAVAIVIAGLRIVTRSSRVLVDEALPADELDAVRDAIAQHGAPEVVGFHKLRARRAGSRRYIDLHVQFRDGTTLSRAHEISHELQRAIRARLRGADVLIHLEPEDAADRVRTSSPPPPHPPPAARPSNRGSR
jgi:cation diffusion facilitator family transporter